MVAGLMRWASGLYSGMNMRMSSAQLTHVMLSNANGLALVVEICEV
jgi:hypothetical protein